MNVSKLKDMKNGWFIGDFNPTLIRTSDVEVAIKKYHKGDYEKRSPVLLQGKTKLVSTGK